MKIIRHPHAGSVGAAIAIGSFDGVHLGHQAILAHVERKSRSLGLRAAVLTFEPLPREFFHPAAAPPRLTCLTERLDALSRASIQVAYVQRFDAAFAAISAEQFEERLPDRYGARWVAVGEDFRYGARRMGDLQSLREAIGLILEHRREDSLCALPPDAERELVVVG